MRVTLTGLEVFEEASTTYEFLVSEAPSRTNLKTEYRNIILEIRNFGGQVALLVSKTFDKRPNFIL